ncbi:hypothetical protein OESDEN_22413 [Oesophagostomum dentatum]|uniref:Uncharacterized protein n=1 Tax=Oesophagostomum dentatum TaxID=61180 RepID=A0A0B1S3A6_OESDE|nr:hypothetical protein OESDEN_22413 [Oesophagostomum dentatum]
MRLLYTSLCTLSDFGMNIVEQAQIMPQDMAGPIPVEQRFTVL